MSDVGLRVTPEQLVALNDEIAMLVRAGVPLELGLRELNGSVPTALGRISGEISQRLQEGVPLTESLSATLPYLPRVYAAVVDAGLKAGNLPKALESLSRFVRQGLELRHRIEFAFLYPLFVFLLAYALFLTFVVETAPHWHEIWGEFVPIADPYVTAMASLSQSWQSWAWIPPAIIFVLIVWWTLFGRSSFLPDRRPSALLNFIPGLRSIINFWHWANFCELLATLLEHQVPLPAAINLAADATGNVTIHNQMTAVSAELQTGKSMSDCLRGRMAIPPYLRWSLGSAQHPDAFQSALLHGTANHAGFLRARASPGHPVVGYSARTPARGATYVRTTAWRHHAASRHSRATRYRRLAGAQPLWSTRQEVQRRVARSAIRPLRSWQDGRNQPSHQPRGQRCGRRGGHRRHGNRNDSAARFHSRGFGSELGTGHRRSVPGYGDVAVRFPRY